MITICQHRCGHTPLEDPVSVYKMPVGTVFRGRIHNMLSLGYSGLFMRIYDNLVLLDGPEKTWKVENRSSTLKVDVEYYCDICIQEEKQ